MPEEPIVCRYVFTPREYRRALRCYYRRSRWWLIALFLFIGAISIWPLFTEPNEHLAISIFVQLAPLMLIFGVLYFFGAKLQALLLFRRSAYFNKEMVYTFYSNGVNAKSPITDTNMQWALFVRAIEDESGFGLFHQGKRVFNWMPKGGFSSEAEVARFRELVRRNVADTRKLQRA